MIPYIMAGLALGGFILDRKAAENRQASGYAEARAREEQRQREAIEILRDSKKLTATQAAKYLKSGVEIHVGTPYRVISQSARDAIADAEMVRQYGVDEAGRIRGIADAEKEAAGFSAFANLLRSGAQAYGMYEQGEIASGRATEGEWSRNAGFTRRDAMDQGMPVSDGMTYDYMMSRYGR